MASHYANLAAYMDRQGPCGAGELFRTLSRYHAIQALAKRGEAAALAQENGLLWEDQRSKPLAAATEGKLC
ncbi:hypothetical protein MKK70_07530 [Methylobacterium sp. E-041]|uniref:hypothetical protein n=1 Tax=Methylobacterium sp. E-041 TaxID=2836573 RepID=UPI001FB975B6|nr:hypothetical protein [Methylobacterium sp. E-041]MCJ2105233.1 hypothetical protein [Methylobacterium sp. E-041]